MLRLLGAIFYTLLGVVSLVVGGSFSNAGASKWFREAVRCLLGEDSRRR